MGTQIRLQHTRHPSILLLLSCFVRCSTSPTTSSVPAPLSLSPSFEWDGNDGRWSSISIQVGTPPQVVRLLPSTSGNSVWTVLDVGCGESDGTDCPNSRGNLFNINSSTTWEDQGLFRLPLTPLNYLPYSGNANVGFDNITLNWEGAQDVPIARQVITGFLSDDFHLGNLGLSPRSINITGPTDQFSSLIGTLSENNVIPSTSWSYLAGASYRSYPVSAFASLTFGGYDSTRFRGDQNLTLAGGSDEFRPMLLGIESITSDADILLSDPIITALDSTVAQIWLPVSACQAFESAFGLVWNETYSLYIVDDSQHAALMANNRSITFTLSTGIASSPDRLNITLPYAAFDMMAGPPLVVGNEPLRYFPLKRAANETQHTLGRTFLQEVYMIADYSRGRITLYPAVYPEGDVPSNIVTICPPNSTTCISPISRPSQQSTNLATGAIAGIAVGGVLAALILGLAVFYLRRRHRKPLPEKPFLAATTADDHGRPEFKPELPATEVSAPKVCEMESNPDGDYAESVKRDTQFQPLHELEGRFPRSASGQGPGPWELPDNAILSELPAEVPRELPSNRD